MHRTHRQIMNRGFALLITAGALVPIILVLLVRGSLETDRQYYILCSKAPITKIELYSMNAGETQRATNLTIRDNRILEQINKTLRYPIPFDPQMIRNHDIFVKMQIYKPEPVYKREKITIDLLRTQHDGWIIDIQGRDYKDDSLIHVLSAYQPTIFPK